MFHDHVNSRAEYRAWLSAITSTHQRRVRVRVLDLDHKVKADVSHMFVDGQVTIDVTRDTTRVATLTLEDHRRSIGFEPDTIKEIPAYGSRMIRIDFLVMVPDLGRWVSCPVFTGPVADFDRDGPLVTIVAEGKERLALGTFGRSRTWGRKKPITRVIRQILKEAGETRFSLPNLRRKRLPERLTVSRDDRPWLVARKLAHSVDRKLTYDGRGKAKMRVAPSAPTLTIRPEWLASPIELDRTVTAAANRWIIRGPKPKGGKKRIKADITLPKKHPLSAQRLSRNGRPLWRIHRETNPNIGSRRKALRIARRMRDDEARAVTHLTVDTLVLPHLEEFDLVRVVDPLVGTHVLRVRQATIPLGEGPMTIGQVKRAYKRRRRGRLIPDVKNRR